MPTYVRDCATPNSPLMIDRGGGRLERVERPPMSGSPVDVLAFYAEKAGYRLDPAQLNSMREYCEQRVVNPNP